MPAPKTVAKRLYDVAILGPDVGGAAAAVLCARRGMRVLLAPLQAVGAARESEGWLLPGASPVLPPLRQLSAAVAPVEEAGLGADLQRVAASGTGGFQILSDKLRLSLPADTSRRKAELRRELSDIGAAEAEAAIESLEAMGHTWDQFVMEPPPWPPRGYFEKRRLQKTVPKPPPIPEGLIGDCLQALAPFAASLVGETAPEATGREAAAMFRAPLRFWGGAAQLAEMMRDKADAAGADIVDGDAEQLRVDKKSVAFRLGGSEVTAHCVILACGAERIGALVQDGGRVERGLATEAALPVQRKVTLAHYIVKPQGLPIALEEATLLLGHAMGPLLLSNMPARKAKGETEGERCLTVARVSDAGFSDERGLINSIRTALEPILPFFDKHIVYEAADLEPLQPHTVLRSDDATDPIGLRPFSEAHERILFASSATYPGFGLEGQMLAARAVAEQAHSISGRKTVSAT